MINTFTYILLVILLLLSSTFAASVEDYVQACINNQANRMGPELCECMGNKGAQLSENEFEFFYAIAAKDQEKINKGH